MIHQNEGVKMCLSQGIFSSFSWNGAREIIRLLGAFAVLFIARSADAMIVPDSAYWAKAYGFVDTAELIETPYCAEYSDLPFEEEKITRICFEPYYKKIVVYAKCDAQIDLIDSIVSSRATIGKLEKVRLPITLPRKETKCMAWKLRFYIDNLTDTLGLISALCSLDCVINAEYYLYNRRYTKLQSKLKTGVVSFPGSYIDTLTDFFEDLGISFNLRCYFDSTACAIRYIVPKNSDLTNMDISRMLKEISSEIHAPFIGGVPDIPWSFPPIDIDPLSSPSGSWNCTYTDGTSLEGIYWDVGQYHLRSTKVIDAWNRLYELGAEKAPMEFNVGVIDRSGVQFSTTVYDPFFSTKCSADDFGCSGDNSYPGYAFGVSYDNHPDLNVYDYFGYSFATSPHYGVPIITYSIDDAHGTAVAGIIGARDNGIGVVGVAPDAHIVPIQYSSPFYEWDHFYDEMIRVFGTDPDDIPVMVIAAGWPLDPSRIDDVEFWFSHYYDNGGLIVAATGNTDTHISFPASSPYVFAVGAAELYHVEQTEWGGDRTDYSNYGNVDVVAPSGASFEEGTWMIDGYSSYIATTDIVDIWGQSCSNYDFWGIMACYSEGEELCCEVDMDSGMGAYTPFTGTSAAAPQVAGLAILLKCLEPSLAGWDIEDIIRRTAYFPDEEPLADGLDRYDRSIGYGMMDALAAVEELQRMRTNRGIHRCADFDYMRDDQIIIFPSNDGHHCSRIRLYNYNYHDGVLGRCEPGSELTFRIEFGENIYELNCYVKDEETGWRELEIYNDDGITTSYIGSDRYHIFIPPDFSGGKYIWLKFDYRLDCTDDYGVEYPHGVRIVGPIPIPPFAPPVITTFEKTEDGILTIGFEKMSFEENGFRIYRRGFGSSDWELVEELEPSDLGYSYGDHPDDVDEIVRSYDVSGDIPADWKVTAFKRTSSGEIFERESETSYVSATAGLNEFCSK